MTRKRMTDAEKRALIEAYQAWEPNGGEGVEALANRFGTTRSTLYTILGDEGIPLKTGRVKPRLIAETPLREDLSKVLAEVLLDQNRDLKNRVAALEIENAALHARLEGATSSR